MLSTTRQRRKASGGLRSRGSGAGLRAGNSPAWEAVHQLLPRETGAGPSCSSTAVQPPASQAWSQSLHPRARGRRDGVCSGRRGKAGTSGTSKQGPSRPSLRSSLGCDTTVPGDSNRPGPRLQPLCTGRPRFSPARHPTLLLRVRALEKLLRSQVFKEPRRQVGPMVGVATRRTPVQGAGGRERSWTRQRRACSCDVSRRARTRGRPVSLRPCLSASGRAAGCHHTAQLGAAARPRKT